MKVFKRMTPIFESNVGAHAMSVPVLEVMCRSFDLSVQLIGCGGTLGEGYGREESNGMV